MARFALVVSSGTPGSAERRLGKICDFFGIPWKLLEASQPEAIAVPADGGQPYALFASLEGLAGLEASTKGTALVREASGLYLYPGSDGTTSARAFDTLWGKTGWSLAAAPEGSVRLGVSKKLNEVTGPMAGVEISGQRKPGDLVLVPASNAAPSRFTTVMSADTAPTFVRFEHDGVPAFLCTSPGMVDIDEPVQRFFDVKEHFRSVVPYVMFLTAVFPDAMWRSQETGACLIIDDPLLRLTYGFCDFPDLLKQMKVHHFTTNIAFIPWNWRRTSPEASDFFRTQQGFSVSIHGCDHTAGEFGVTSPDLLDGKARLAQSRMRRHHDRTGIRHDPIMIFPQGVFSTRALGALHSNGFIAAVNTEVNPVDSGAPETSIRDVWGLAITKFGGSPLFTRRYPSHGLENFAFDMLLGKPALIVAHHQDFRDGGASVVDFVEKLNSLNTVLRWRPLGGVIRRACRRRSRTSVVEDVEMFASETVVSNPANRPLEVAVHKTEANVGLVKEVRGAGGALAWSAAQGQVRFTGRIEAESEAEFRVVYDDRKPAPGRGPRRFDVSVAVRRYLSEFRDEYVHKLSPRS